jgi:hypothetical protein
MVVGGIGRPGGVAAFAGCKHEQCWHYLFSASTPAGPPLKDLHVHMRKHVHMTVPAPVVPPGLHLCPLLNMQEHLCRMQRQRCIRASQAHSMLWQHWVACSRQSRLVMMTQAPWLGRVSNSAQVQEVGLDTGGVCLNRQRGAAVGSPGQGLGKVDIIYLQAQPQPMPHEGTVRPCTRDVQ